MRLGDQDRSLWTRSLIDEGHALVRACLRRNMPGPYQIQAAIAAVHADAPTAAATDWSQIVQLYDQLLGLHADTDRRAQSGDRRRRARWSGTGAGDPRRPRPRQLPPLSRCSRRSAAAVGSYDEAVAAYDRALDLTTNAVERDHLRRRHGPLDRSP